MNKHCSYSITFFLDLQKDENGKETDGKKHTTDTKDISVDDYGQAIGKICPVVERLNNSYNGRIVELIEMAKLTILPEEKVSIKLNA